ncbi:hypothetical protein, partial [Acinetobacter indicus]|uniref:hypothetical protein n=1 Tax=Acinetobacter indicus TaxID=756892 RepID=UPI001C5DEA25
LYRIKNTETSLRIKKNVPTFFLILPVPAYAKLKTQKPHPFYAGECDGGPWKTCENTHFK